MIRGRWAAASAGAALTAAFLAIYAPDLGHGFIKDDFGWIRQASAIASAGDLLRSNTGFYRPLVTLSFGLDYQLWRLSPLGYGVTNLVLCLLDAALLWMLARKLALGAGAATLAAGVWALNLHGINLSLLWLSGRTALLVTLFALLVAHAMLRGRALLAGIAALLAMLCKEEAVLLPLLWSAVCHFERESSSRRWSGLRDVALRTGPLWIALAAYLWLRSQSGAFGPANAPTYYQFSFAPALLLRNLLEYADRGGSVALVAIAVAVAASGFSRAPFEAAERRALRIALLWIAASYALTLFLPVRSSLYALLPSVGSALAAGAFASRAARLAAERFARAALALTAAALLLIPVYRTRNQRLVCEAELSARTLALVEQEIARRPGGATLALVDDPEQRCSFRSAFGSILNDALALYFGPKWRGKIVQPGETLPPNARLFVQLTPEGSLTAKWLPRPP